MLEMNDLIPGRIILVNDSPCEIIESAHSFVGRGQATRSVKVKNLFSGAQFVLTARPSQRFAEADLEKNKVRFLYQNRGKFCFIEKDDPAKRFLLNEDQLGAKKFFIKDGVELTARFFRNELVDIELPPKIELRVTEAPPGVKGNTAARTIKDVLVETGLSLKAPLFIETGDIILVNTRTGEYDSRVKKAR